MTMGIARPMISNGPLAQLLGYRDCLCPDGVRRTVRCGIPDSFFSAPGRVKVKGKTVSGFVTSIGNAREDGSYDYKFVPTGKNANVFAGWDSGHKLPESAPTLPDGHSWYWADGLNCWANSADRRVMDGFGNEWTDYSALYETCIRRDP
jgi:hypothetical protein